MLGRFLVRIIKNIYYYIPEIILSQGWNDILEALMLSNTDPGTGCDNEYDLQKLPLTVDPKTANGMY